MVQVYCKNTQETKRFPEGTSLLQMLSEFDCHRPYPIVSAKVNNVSQGLKFKVYQNKDIEFIDVRESSGMRVYCRSLCFLLYKAASDMFPGSKLYMEHPISHGYFCHLRKADDTEISAQDLVVLERRMKELVEKDMPFHRYDVQTERAIKEFRKAGYEDKVKLLETSGEAYTDYYTLGETSDYYYGKLVPSTGYLKVWGIMPYHDGLLLQLPSREDPSKVADFVDQPRTYEIFKEALRWNIIMGLATVGDVNEAFLHGRASELIQIAEALQEKRLSRLQRKSTAGTAASIRSKWCSSPVRRHPVKPPSASACRSSSRPVASNPCP